MDTSLLPPVIVEVAHVPSPRADLVAVHVGPAVAQASAAPARKRQGNVVVPGGNPTAPAAKARAPGANAVVRSRPVAEKVTKAAGVKRRRIQAPPSSSYSIPERDAPAMPFNGVAPPRKRVVQQNGRKDKISQHRYKDMEASEGKFFKLEHCWELLQKCEKWKLTDKESLLLAEENKIM
ncbi:Lactation elevated protein 1 [Hordeum vulgare]|nr:Lactation elevated protein 1 [Hordeum vulgare]